MYHANIMEGSELDCELKNVPYLDWCLHSASLMRLCTGRPCLTMIIGTGNFHH